jgi:hypothetical protein
VTAGGGRAGAGRGRVGAGRSRAGAVWAGVRWLVVFEFRLWRSLFRWVARRPSLPGRHPRPFPYAKPILPILWVFIGLNAFEIPLFHFVLPWPTVRLVIDVLGAYGLFWMLGLLASIKVHPHLVHDDGLRIRYAATVDIEVPWAAVDRVTANTRNLGSSRTLHVDRDGADVVVSVAAGGYTDVDIVLREPRPLPVRRTRGEPVRHLRVVVDDPKAFVAAARERLAAHAP